MLFASIRVFKVFNMGEPYTRTIELDNVFNYSNPANSLGHFWLQVLILNLAEISKGDLLAGTLMETFSSPSLKWQQDKQ